MSSPTSEPVAANRLARETSPYLRQHAHNPVDWFPWSAAALARARRENKPILLSIGYSACHWCHVMAHESFEDAATAKVMNELFVNIKVDREERPDLDRIYQIAHQMLAQRAGGWPLTMFLTPDDHRPFFGGTYFPKTPRYGMPAFTDILQRVAAYHEAHQPEIRTQNAALADAFTTLYPQAAAPGTALTLAPVDQARTLLEDEFDREYGGFGGAPKFPHPALLELLLRRWRSSARDPKPDLQALLMATLTLKRMAEGGLFDQLGGGFSRYSVDQYWMIPHFEKMLYDNGPLLALYADAALATGDEFYARIAADTAQWVLREMQSPAGGYYSSLDADSEGHEGKFYVWDKPEVQDALTGEEYRVFERRYGLYHAANFEGRWHLHVYDPIEEIADPPPAIAGGGSAIQGIRGHTKGGKRGNTQEVQALLDSARGKLLALREQRVRPGRDEKILASWNALMIRGMAIAARRLGRADLEQSATRALDFLRERLWRNGRLLATGLAQSGVEAPALPAYLDDYVYLIDAILELLQTRWRSEDLAWAVELTEVVLARFADSEHGGFYFTADDHEQLMHRPKSFSDDATPSGNGVAAYVLNRLGTLLAEPRYLEAAERTLRAGWRPLEKYPQGHATLVIALDEYVNAVETVILRGPEAAAWQAQLSAIYTPRRMVFAVPDDASGLPEALSSKTASGSTIAYVCRGTTCSAPITSLASLIATLDSPTSPTSPSA